MLVALVLSAAGFIGDWGRVNFDVTDGADSFSTTVTLSGIGNLDVHVAGLKDEQAKQFVEDRAKSDVHPQSPGVTPIVAGLVAIVAGAGFLQGRSRSLFAVVAAISGAVALIYCLTEIADVPGMFNNAVSGHFSPGWGAITACVAALAVLALGVTAFVLERMSLAAIARYYGYATPGGVYPPPSASSPPPPAPHSPPERPPVTAKPKRVPGEPATVGDRARALLIDWLICGLVLVIYLPVLVAIGLALNATWATVVWFSLGGLLAWVTPAAYFTLLEARYGQTVGERVAGIVVVGPTDALPTLAESLRRNVVHLAVCLVPIAVLLVVPLVSNYG
jgi:uncharacterized RDD family membrane protein YckC